MPSSPEQPAIALGVRPSGMPFLREAPGEETPADPAVAARVRGAFDQGPFHGLLHLGAVEPGAVLPASLGFGRGFAMTFMTALCAVADLETAREKAEPAFPDREMEGLLGSMPPLAGGEYVSVETLRGWWQGVLAIARERIGAHRGPVQELLRAWNPAWNLVGRVWFHLAENKRHPAAPFAFMATYTARLGAHARPQHIPLGRALVEYAGEDAREALVTLLAPVQRAADSSTLVRRLVDSGEVFHPLAWTPSEALPFLRDIPAMESAGVLVRVPDWWNARRPPRPSVKVTVGSRQPSGFGAGAMLDFSVDLALDGEPLGPEDWDAISASTDGLVLLKGRWVEVDRDKLAAVLDHWKSVQRAAASDGVPFLEAMRLLAGGGRAGEGAQEIGSDQWSQVESGAWLAGVLERLRSPEAITEIDPGQDLKATLRPYQRVGVRWLWALVSLGLGGCLADDMGLGKTVQVLAVLLMLRRERRRVCSLLVAPASLLGNWKAEIARFAPSLRIRVAHGSAAPEERVQGEGRELDGVDLVMTTYGSVHRFGWLGQRDWGLVVLDEAQAIKNAGARQARVVKTLRARTRLCLTGTPVENRLADLWSLFDFLLPGLLGSIKKFGEWTRHLERAGGFGPLRKLVGPYILRRLKTDPRVISDLPDKTEMLAWCSLTKVQAVLYQKAVEELRARLAAADGMQRRGTILAFLMRFKQICNHPSQWLGDGTWAPEASGKLARLREIAEQVESKQEKMLVFTQFRETTAPLAAFLAGVLGRPGLVLHGQVPVGKRKQLVDAFQGDDGPPFFVLSLKAGGTGLNLTAASHVVHFDRWWNPAVENQATDRAFRIGQKKNVLVHKLVCKGTIEERIDELITSKRELAEQVVGEGAERLLTEMSNDEVMRLVSLDLEAAMGAGDT
jgi:non-specific serine/threonine protein kinase